MDPREGGPFPAASEDPATHVWVLDADGVVVRVDERAESLAGPDGPAGGRLPAAADWHDAGAVRSLVEGALAGTDGEATVAVEGPDGDTAALDLAARPVRGSGADDDTDGGGADGAAVVVGRAVTEYVRDRRTLAEQRETMVALHDVATELVRCERPGDVYERTVEAAEAIFDLDLCFIGVVEGDRIVPTANSKADDRHVPVLSTDHGVAAETLRTGESFLVEDAMAPDNRAEPVRDTYRSGMSVPVGEDAIFQAVATERGAFDETDLEFVETLAAHAAESARRARTERTLRRQNERLEEFASVVAHDIRDPLAGIRANAEVARETGDEESFSAILSSVDRLEALVAELLELSRAGEVVDEPERVAVRAVAREAWTAVDAPEATLSVDHAGDVRADPPRLRRLFGNLLSNAVAHGGADVTVRVGALEGGETGFFVADDGPGIPADERERVFERGYTTSDDGTGFGLAIVDQIARAHGWSVALVESEAGGARFEFTGA